MYAVTSIWFVRRTRAIFRRAEFGFFGVIVRTWRHTPRFWGAPGIGTWRCRRLFQFLRSAGALTFEIFGFRPLRTSWLIVGTETRSFRGDPGAAACRIEWQGPPLSDDGSGFPGSLRWARRGRRKACRARQRGRSVAVQIWEVKHGAAGPRTVEGGKTRLVAMPPLARRRDAKRRVACATRRRARTCSTNPVRLRVGRFGLRLGRRFRTEERVRLFAVATLAAFGRERVELRLVLAFGAGDRRREREVRGLLVGGRPALLEERV